MKKITMFLLASCPYCRTALRLIDDVKHDHPEYEDLQIEKIDEGLHPEIARQFDYYYVPTLYIEGVKIHEGPVSRATIEAVFRKAKG